MHIKHAFIQYYAMKSNILLLIIKVKNIHEFNALSINLWILKYDNYPSLTYFTMFSPNNIFLGNVLRCL
jgi:hypothetical protein